jgi:hypothetical protein
MVHYRRFDADEADLKGMTLEKLCRAALGVGDSSKETLWQRARDRVFDAGGTDGRQILLNKVADLTSAVFGELCLMQQGGLQALLELKPSTVQLSDITKAQVFNLGEQSAPIGSHFVRGMAYWLAIGNHVFLVKTHSMTTDHLQTYFSWLLKKCTATMAEEVTFALRAEFDKSQVVGDVGEIRSLRISGNAAPHMAVTIPAGEGYKHEIKTSRKIADKVVQFAQAISIVEVLFGKPRADSLVESLGDNEYLSVDAAVKITGRRTAATKGKLREIANDLADMTDGKVQIEGKDGKISDGDAILRTRMPFSVPHEASNLLEFDNVADQLQEVYRRFVKDGKIKG